ncbi:MAG: ferredoxin [Candidatus Glassbacteria bacterium]|nr:ferredoxin [Candidatus Glassbacteria bacterium]
MKASVDADLCTGCGLCEDTCPEVFEMDGEVAKVIVDTVPAEAEDTCREAAESCPVEAIAVEE